MQNYSKAGEEQSENESFCLSSEVSKVTEAVESTGQWSEATSQLEHVAPFRGYRRATSSQLSQLSLLSSPSLLSLLSIPSILSILSSPSIPSLLSSLSQPP